MRNADGTDGHYFSASPAVPSERRTVRLVLPDLSLELTTDRGVFSGDRVDAGTKLLLSEVAVPTDLRGDVLDLGCGYGAIAVTLARRAPSATVWALDVNERALALAAENATSAGVGGRVRAVRAEELPADVRFSAVFSNPPIRIGKAALHDLLVTWLSRLTPGGRGFLVVQKHLGSDSLAKWLREQGLRVDRIGSRMGYRLLEVAPA
ncbi:MAG TPA: methyltransferase [Acidimicrobiales bacterium]|nr:methyltransferase [Acidimicrobiales bacterium]